jgi:raffinose/stachyose/melibiose transport system substrate-binding protein
MRKFLFIILCVFIGYGCGGNSAHKENTITVWHWMTDRDEAFQDLAQKYQEQTGVKVEMELFAPSDVYSKKITAAAQARVLPDIFGVLNKKHVFASYVKNGFVADLTDAFKANDSEWEKKFFEKALQGNSFDEDNSYGVTPGIYGVPLDVTNIQMLYNKKLLQKAGLEAPPKTFDEFLYVADALKRMGLGVFVSGWGEPWMMECFASNYAFNIMGEEKVMATIKGEVPYTDPDWIQVLDVFRQMKDRGLFIDGIVTKGNKQAEQDFALERAVFAFNGSWCVNVYGKMNPTLEYAPMVPPVINPHNPMRIWGGPGSSFVVNGQSRNKQKAIDFLKWLTAQEQQAYLSEKTKNLPATKEALDNIPDILSQFAQAMEISTHPTIWKYNELPIVMEQMNRGIQSILIGDKTPQQVAQDVQKAKEKIMKRQKRD